jgi:hypothetical protein
VLRIGFMAGLVLGLALLIVACGSPSQAGPSVADASGTVAVPATQPGSDQVPDSAASVVAAPGSPTPAPQVAVAASETPTPGPSQSSATPTVPPSPTASPTGQPGPTQEQQRLLADLENFGPAPELQNEVWLNSQPLQLADLRGKVVMVDFWTFG